MLNIVVISGGSGSTELQKGLSELLGYGNYKIDIIINAFDNGKSTGTCRRVFHNNILGPSDLRKNHILNFKLKYDKELKENNKYYCDLLSLFEIRLSAENPEEYYKKAFDLINNQTELPEYRRKELIEYIDIFFKINSKTLMNESFKDFALSNIFYASAAFKNKNSLSEAGKIMSDFLHLNNNVYLVSDKSLFLKAKTENKSIIDDEAKIVDWNNSNDKIDYIYLENKFGNTVVPKISNKTKILIKNADIIIFSSGTQFSSLIPTYIHKGFYNIIKDSKAKKYLVMNNIQDKDMIGFNSNDILNKIEDYLDLKDIKIIVNSNSDESMQAVKNGKYSKNVIEEELSEKCSKKHNGVKLAAVILKDFFNLSKNVKLIADFDGTIYDNKFMDITDDNILKLNKLNGSIISGNTSKHIYSLIFNRFKDTVFNFNIILCSYGIEELGNNGKIICQDIIDNSKIKDTLKILYNDRFIIDDKIVHIKPFENREKEIKKIKRLKLPDCSILQAGKTSVDIIPMKYLKSNVIKEKFEKDNILYIGNELLNKNGNDYSITLDKSIKFFNVNDIFETNNILRVIEFINR